MQSCPDEPAGVHGACPVGVPSPGQKVVFRDGDAESLNASEPPASEARGGLCQDLD